MKVAHLTSVHPADDSRILAKQCQSLADLGVDVTLVVANDNKVDTANVNLVRLQKPKGFLSRLLITNFQLLFFALRSRFDIYHFHDPELIPYLSLLRLFGKKVIFDAHEDLSLQINNKLWIPKLLRKPLAWVAKAFYKFADLTLSGIVTVTPTIIKQFKNKHTALVRNFPKLSEFNNVTQKSAAKGNQVVYVGGITKIRGLEEDIQAINKVSEKYNATLTVAGNFQTEAFENTIKQMDLTNTNFKGWLSREQIANLLAESKLGLVTLHPVANYIDAYPVKMFEYMAAGVPVIASDFPVYKEIIETADCGLVVDPLDPDAIAKAIEKALSDEQRLARWSSNAQQAVKATYNWESEVHTLMALYRKVVK